MSLQMVVTQPNVSTVWSPLTRALLRAMRRMPRHSVIVTTMGSPSGIAATASDTAMLNICGREEGVGGVAFCYS